MSKFNSGLFHGTNGSPQQTIDLLGTGEGASSAESSFQAIMGTQRDRLLAQATTAQARGIVAELYRNGAEIGDGGTAGAIREETATGSPVGGRRHIQKGRQRLRQIERILARNPNHPDRELPERLANDLRDALGGVR